MQAGILEPIPAHAVYLRYSLVPGTDPRPALRQLTRLVDGRSVIAGIGATLAAELSARVPGLRPFPPLVGAGVELPSTPSALWFWLRGDDPGELFLQSDELAGRLGKAFSLQEHTTAFRHREGRDLSGYQDGTENPVAEAAQRTALLQGVGPGFDGSSFAAVQRWRHDFPAIRAMTPEARDLAIGRRLQDNREIEDAPPCAHVKRTAQEQFEPPAYTLRRSMPWLAGGEGGLMFVSFGAAFDAFEAQLRRMAGMDDGTRDAVFGMSRPQTGAYYWCPPMDGARLDLRGLGL